MLRGVLALAVGLFVPALATAEPVLVAAPAVAGPEVRLDDHTLLVPGGFEPGKEPDGNSVIIEGRQGLLVFDTGRHVDHSDAILAAAKALGKPIVAIANSHWHLDHVSGNVRLRAAFPNVLIYASNAIDDALTGFLKDNAEQARRLLAENKLDAASAAEVRGDLATFEAGDRLRPNVVVMTDRPLPLAGRRLNLYLVHKAATAGDIWLYDPDGQRAAVGDLVTLPVPFLDTACPQGWAAALRGLDAQPFVTLVPGHGPVMTHADFHLWRTGYDAFIGCAMGSDPLIKCVNGWLVTAQHFVGQTSPRDAAMADYYAELIRTGKLAKYC